MLNHILPGPSHQIIQAFLKTLAAYSIKDSGAAARPHEADSEGPCFQNNGFCNKRRATEGRNQFRMKSYYFLVKRARAPVASSPSGNAGLVGRILEVLDDQSVRWHHGSIAPCSSSTSSCLSDQSTGMDGAPTNCALRSVMPIPFPMSHPTASPPCTP